ncbi:MAG: hypothetical protein JRI32_07225 [Deltaproteobacteria bacterium]|nr:hypothetical protein [Deltaproteobacteria bacterium]
MKNQIITSPFEQVESSISRKYQGTGLGLSLSKTLVNLHGGWIWCKSKGEGKGSSFRFIIPTQTLRTSWKKLILRAHASQADRSVSKQTLK